MPGSPSASGMSRTCWLSAASWCPMRRCAAGCRGPAVRRTCRYDDRHRAASGAAHWPRAATCGATQSSQEGSQGATRVADRRRGEKVTPNGNEPPPSGAMLDGRNAPHVGIVFFGRIGELQCRPSGISFGGIGLGTEPSITQCNVNLSARDVPPDSDIGPAVFGASALPMGLFPGRRPKLTDNPMRPTESEQVSQPPAAEPRTGQVRHASWRRSAQVPKAR